MSDWWTMFRGVQALTRSAKSFDEGIGQTIAFARNNKGEYNEPEYWKHLDQLETDYPTYEVTAWAREGLEKLPAEEGWGFLILDLGDAPDIFHLYRFGYYSASEGNLQRLGHDGAFNESKLRRLLSGSNVIDFRALEQCFDADPTQSRTDAVSGDVETLSYYGVAELNSEIFSWNRGGSFDWHGSSGELAWLAFGSFALIEPLRSLQFCQRVLGSRRALYLLSGFEEIFFYLATITPDGLTFDV